MLPSLVKPLVLPPLDPDFSPAVLFNRRFRQEVEGCGVHAVIGLERNPRESSRVEFSVFPDDHPMAVWNTHYIERIVKFLLWQRGGHTIHFSGPGIIASYLAKTYAADGARAFDHQFFGKKVYEREFQVVHSDEEHIPGSREIGKKLGGNLNGYRIGFDLGASDRKVSAVVDGVPIFSEERIWEPRKYTDPDYHYREIMCSILAAAEKMPQVDAIGGSSAGIIIDNRPMVASIFRGISENDYEQVKNIFLRIRDEIGVPLEVINDGDVTALAGSMAIKENGILGIALGSSLAAGYVNAEGHIMGWLNELAFAPVDYNPNAPIDEWSGDRGCGASYFSQQCVFRLAPDAGIFVPGDLSDAEKLKFIQEKLESGDEGARKIWETIGVYLGYGIAHYADFYDLHHVLILGRCSSGSGGDLILEGVKKVFSTEFPELLRKIYLHLPNETIRRVGQSLAAASLPFLPPTPVKHRDTR